MAAYVRGNAPSQTLIAASLVGIVLGVISVVFVALLTLLLFLASSAVRANTPGLGLAWLIVFAMWAYSIAMIWSGSAGRKGSKTGWGGLPRSLGVKPH